MHIPFSNVLNNVCAPLLLIIDRDLPSEDCEWLENVPDVTRCSLRHLIYTHHVYVHRKKEENSTYHQLGLVSNKQ